MSAPIDPKWHELMNRLAKGLDEAFNGDGPKNIVFTLFIFDVGHEEGRRVNYISNGNRDDMIVAVKEWLARAEGRHVETETQQ